MTLKTTYTTICDMCGANSLDWDNNVANWFRFSGIAKSAIVRGKGYVEYDLCPDCAMFVNDFIQKEKEESNDG